MKTTLAAVLAAVLMISVAGAALANDAMAPAAPAKQEVKKDAACEKEAAGDMKKYDECVKAKEAKAPAAK